MGVKIPSQRGAIVDIRGQIATPWWQFLSSVAVALNAKRFTASAESSSVTGTTDETTLATIPIVMGTRGIVRLTLYFSMTANANTKTVLVTIGTQTAQTYTLGNADSGSVTLLIVGSGKASQTTMTTATRSVTAGNSAATTEDMSVATNITISGILGTITDTIALDIWALEVEQN